MAEPTLAELRDAAIEAAKATMPHGCSDYCPVCKMARYLLALDASRQEHAERLKAKWLTEHAGQFWTIPPLEIDDDGTGGNALAEWKVWRCNNRFEWELETQIEYLCGICDTFEEAENELKACYRERITSALRPAIGEVKS